MEQTKTQLDRRDHLATYYHRLRLVGYALLIAGIGRCLRKLVPIYLLKGFALPQELMQCLLFAALIIATFWIIWSRYCSDKLATWHILAIGAGWFSASFLIR